MYVLNLPGLAGQRNTQLLGRVWFASQPASLPVGSLCIDFPRLDIVLRGEYGNLLEAKQQRMVEGEMLFIPARAANLPVNNKPVMLLSLVFAPTWLGLSFYDSRTTSLLHPARQIQLPSLQRGEGEAMLTALTHLSRSPLEQNIIQPLVLSLLHLCRNVVNMPPGNSQPRGDFLYHSICNWVQDNYAQPLTRESVAQFFNITPNHLSKLFAQHGTMRFIEYVRLVQGSAGDFAEDGLGADWLKRKFRSSGRTALLSRQSLAKVRSRFFHPPQVRPECYPLYHPSRRGSR